METEQELTPEKESPANKKNKAPEKERQGPQYEGDLQSYKNDKQNWPFIARVAVDYGWSFIHNDKNIVYDNIPQNQLRQAVTVAELYKARKLR